MPFASQGSSLALLIGVRSLVRIGKYLLLAAILFLQGDLPYRRDPEKLLMDQASVLLDGVFLPIEGGYHAFDRALEDCLCSQIHATDLEKAKQIADLARKLKIENELEFDLEIVDICYEAGEPEIWGKPVFPGYVFEDCKHLLDKPSAYVEYVCTHGSHFDIATLYANGIFVEQDFWKAISHVVQDAYGPNQLKEMVGTLHEAIKKGSLEKEFDPYAFPHCRNFANAWNFLEEAKEVAEKN